MFYNISQNKLLYNHYNPMKGWIILNRISEITKRDILNLLKDGFYIDEGFSVKEHYSPYHGLIEEIDFLKRLYDLESMPSTDPRFSNAEGDIWQHTINNFDYDYCWVFEDDRFQLKNGDDAEDYDLELIGESGDRRSIIRFYVHKYESTDFDNDDLSSVVPFQVAYAVLIHKAQGLEYNSVKIVITDEVEEMITHNIFYTAITRAKKQLKIYWTPETEYKVISNMKRKDIKRDLYLLKSRLGQLVN